METLARHRLQMPRQERIFLDTFIRKLSGWNLDGNPHLFERLMEKNITREQVLEALKRGIVVEVKSNGRFVVRFDQPMQDSVVAVVDVPRRTVVTAWRNRAGDTHLTLNLAAYTWQTTAQSVCAAFLR